jgi:hypothetical protein
MLETERSDAITLAARVGMLLARLRGSCDLLRADAADDEAEVARLLKADLLLGEAAGDVRAAAVLLRPEPAPPVGCSPAGAPGVSLGGAAGGD